MVIEPTIFSVVLWILSIVFLFSAASLVYEDEFGSAIFCLVMWVWLGWWGFHEADPETHRARDVEETQRAAARIARETPHVIREVDGCKVYAFESGGRTHYFTRCPGEKVTTDTTHVYSSGKSTKTEVESITTQ